MWATGLPCCGGMGLLSPFYTWGLLVCMLFLYVFFVIIMFIVHLEISLILQI